MNVLSTWCDRDELVRNKCIYEEYRAALISQKATLHDALTEIERAMEQTRTAKATSFASLAPFLPCFADLYGLPLKDCLAVDTLERTTRNVDENTITLVESVTFRRKAIPALHTPTWLFSVMPLLETYLTCEVKLSFLLAAHETLTKARQRKAQKIYLNDAVWLKDTNAAIASIDAHTTFSTALHHHRRRGFASE